MGFRSLVIVYAVCILGRPMCAFANDSTATLGTGGLTLQKTESISMLSEKLRISPKKISLDYEMKNISDYPVETIVAFPFPRQEAPELVNIDVMTDKTAPSNFVHFSVVVDGAAITPALEMRAFAMNQDGSKGKEVTNLLKDAGVLVPPVAKSFYESIANLTPASQKKLVEEKLLQIETFEDSKNYTPLWTLEMAYFWKQRFESGKTVKIHHEYIPVVGHGYFTTYSLTDERGPWCIDKGTEKAIKSMLSKQPKPDNAETLLARRQVDYVLTTGSNWAGPIKAFELLIEKESPEQIVSLCEDGVKKTSPTTFTISRNNFSPTKDLSILFISPMNQG